MSGSSLDGVDIAFCLFDIEKKNQDIVVHDWSLQVAETIAFPERWYNRLYNLPTQSALTFAKTHTYFGHFLGECVLDFIKNHQVEPDFIASHGHTIFHEPQNRVTIQIGDGSAMAATTGYTVINNFRNQDIAIDGEGAPVAPIVDKYLLGGHDFYLNIGGIANISCRLPDKLVAFDICPANQLLNALANQIQLEYDEGGQVAAKGTTDDTLLSALNQATFYQQPYPKSLDNEWVIKNLLSSIENNPERIPDQLRTSVEHIAFQIAQSIRQIVQQENLSKSNYTLFPTGGGVFNTFLMERMSEHCSHLGVQVIIPEPPIIQFKEAILMAWMGVMRMEEVPNIMRTVTGAQRDTVGGAVHFALGLKNQKSKIIHHKSTQDASRMDL